MAVRTDMTTRKTDILNKSSFGWHYEASLSVCLSPFHLRRGIKNWRLENQVNNFRFST